nr:ALPV-136 [Albatrosspox virus]
MFFILLVAMMVIIIVHYLISVSLFSSFLIN